MDVTIKSKLKNVPVLQKLTDILLEKMGVFFTDAFYFMIQYYNF